MKKIIDDTGVDNSVFSARKKIGADSALPDKERPKVKDANQRDKSPHKKKRDDQEDDLTNRKDFKYFYSGRKLL